MQRVKKSGSRFLNDQLFIKTRDDNRQQRTQLTATIRSRLCGRAGSGSADQIEEFLRLRSISTIKRRVLLDRQARLESAERMQV